MTELRHPCLRWPTLASATVAFLLLGPPAGAATARYRLTVDNTWSESTHPGAFPSDAHFSWLAGGTHDDGVSFWSEGVVATPGIKQMAETGVTDLFVNEVAIAVAEGSAWGTLSWQHWFCPPGTTHSSCGPLVVEIDVEETYPLVTLATMLGPSPDWFVGVTALPLRDNGRWLPFVVVDLRPYDGGTRSANLWQLFGPLTIPPEPVSLITTESGQLVGPASLGSFTFELISAPDSDGDAIADDLDNCPQFPNPDQGPAVFGQAVLAADDESFSWSGPVDAAYARGDLLEVATYPTDDGGVLSGASALTDVEQPLAGSGFFYVFRPAGTCTDPSWQTSLGAEPLRDAALP